MAIQVLVPTFRTNLATLTQKIKIQNLRKASLVALRKGVAQKIQKTGLTTIEITRITKDLTGITRITIATGITRIVITKDQVRAGIEVF